MSEPRAQPFFTNPLIWALAFASVFLGAWVLITDLPADFVQRFGFLVGCLAIIATIALATVWFGWPFVVVAVGAKYFFKHFAKKKLLGTTIYWLISSLFFSATMMAQVHIGDMAEFSSDFDWPQYWLNLSLMLPISLPVFLAFVAALARSSFRNTNPFNPS